MNMKLRPLSNHVVVSRIAPKSMSAGKHGAAIHIPETAHDRRSEWSQATVLAVGPGTWGGEDGKHFTPTEVKGGDVVLIGRYAGTDLEVGGEKVTILRETEILAVVTES